ncbi:MAG TPA: metallophosphoesterase [Acidimicrobiales bacterium]
MIFAVEDTTAQLWWEGAMVDVALGDGDPRVAGVEPVAPPPGPMTARIATISDLHVGEAAFGIAPRIHEPGGVHAERYALRAARAAVGEAIAWGAELLVVKGDVTWTGRARQWELAAGALAASPVPVVAIVGNHDVTTKGVDGRPFLEDAGVTVVDAADPVGSVDVAGLRVVLAHTPRLGHQPGAVTPAQRDEVARLVAGAPRPGGAVVVLHHYPDRFFTPTRYPSGLRKADASPMLRAIREANPATLVTCGHSHRHRRYRREGLDVTEVGSTKDYPGVWAGYAVHEGGLRQVVRRIAEPSVIEWTERTRKSVLGLWGRWTPGRLSWRCFSLAWPTRP